MGHFSLVIKMNRNQQQKMMSFRGCYIYLKITNNTDILPTLEFATCFHIHYFMLPEKS